MRIFKSLVLLGGVVASFATSAHSASITDVHFRPGHSVRIALDGEVRRSIYETRQYETTCYRTEYETVDRYVCTPRYRESCSSQPVCRDVSRPICTRDGCTDYPTRECTTETSCSTVSDGEDCRTVTETISHSIPYACTQTETVKVGEELDHTERAEFEIAFTGEGEDSLQDVFHVSVANGLDVGSGFRFVSAKSTGKYLFFLRRADSGEKDVTSGSARYYRGNFVIHGVSTERLVKETKIQVKNLKFTRDQIDFDLSATPAPAFAVNLTISKDKLIGGTKALFSGRVSAQQMTVTPNADGTTHYSIPLAPFGLTFNKRPHIAAVSVGIDFGALFEGETLLNARDLAAIEKKINGRRSLKKKL